MPLVDDWKTWRSRPFPAELAGTEIDRVDVTMIDTFAAGCLDAFFGSGILDSEQIGILQDCTLKLSRVLGQLSGESLLYFAELAELCRRVLTAIGGHGEDFSA